jgi:hypothetical protein
MTFAAKCIIVYTLSVSCAALSLTLWEWFTCDKDKW